MTMAEFERALDETRASVTPEMELDYEQIQANLKQDARSAGAGGIGFIHPGHAHSARREGVKRAAVHSVRPSISTAVARNGAGLDRP